MSSPDRCGSGEQEDRGGRVEWRDIPGFDRGELMARLNGSREVDGAGNVSYNVNPDEGGDPLFEDAAGLLEAAFGFPDGVPEAEALSAVSRALFAPRPKELEEGALLAEVDSRVGAFLSRDPEPYALVGSVAARWFPELGAVQSSGCRLSFHRTVPEPYRDGHRWAEQRVRPHLSGKLPASGRAGPRFSFVVVETEGRSATEAASRARAALDFGRGIWNLALATAWWVPTPAFPRPLNHVLAGPVQSLHAPDGAALPWPVYYDPDYAGPGWMHHHGRLAEGWDRVREYEERAIPALRSSRYRDEVEGFVGDYVAALDGRDPEAAFVRLWGLLERLTGLGRSGEREDHTAVTRRAAFNGRSDVRALQHQVLEKLRRHRNEGVHRGLFPGDVRALVLQLRRFVLLVLQFHLFDHCELAGMQEAATFFDQPSESGPLSERLKEMKRQGREREARMTERAMEYHGHDVPA